jgi:hypothetical protein
MTLFGTSIFKPLTAAFPLPKTFPTHSYQLCEVFVREGQMFLHPVNRNYWLCINIRNYKLSGMFHGTHTTPSGLYLLFVVGSGIK